MPLARIITRTPPDAVSAADYLRSEGYTVEMISPDEFRVAPAKLELNLDKVPAGEAVERARQMVAAHREPPTTPAAATTPPPKAKVAIAYDIAGRPVEFEDEGEAVLERRKAWNRLGTAVLAMLRRGRDWAASSLERTRSAPASASRRRAEDRALRRKSESAREQEEIRQAEQRAQAEAEQAAAHQQARLEAERRAEEREQARTAAVHEAMIAAQRQSEPPQAEPAMVSPSAEEPAVAPVPPTLQRQPASRPVVIHRRRTSRGARRAIAAACGIGFLLLMGFAAYANRRPAAPLSPSALIISGWTKQDVPFGTSVITPPVPVRLAPAAVAKPAAPAVPKPSPAATAPAHKPAPVRAAAAPSRLTAQNDSGAEDEVVVRHVRPSPARRAAAATSGPNLKRYSDLE